MRRRTGLAGVGPVVGLLVLVLLAACGQAEGTPGPTATVTPPGARLGIPGTPNLATPLTPVGVFTQTTLPASPTRAPGSATPTVTPTVMPTGEADATLRAVLAALPETRTIAIEQDWTGLSPDAPIELHYRLARQGEAFVGPARGIGGGYGGKLRATTAEIAVPAETARAFLALLAQTSARAGRYEPAITHTDDYPSISIALETPAGRIVFATESNTEGYVPWRVAVGSAEYVADNDTPHRALELLDLALDRGTGQATSPAGPEPLFCRTPAVPGDPLGTLAEQIDGRVINVAQQFGLAEVSAILLERGNASRVEWREAQQIAAFVALVDQPVAEIRPTFWSQYDSTRLYLQFAGGDSLTVEYNPYLDVIRWRREAPASNDPVYTVAPPGFRDLVLQTVCAK